ncbi:hypothetical protein J0871_16480 [Salegentibacter sp. BDJ18]|uniref:hypothetical protein n=1 Tax=Salegentibacter sp. BDJ18 TaxID=2816376 RepID=UPI001AAEAD01|nr:hypothetical protein [Salegentibacter sp. BDJ18]MBO2546015.1 hypothetical protein [Salegentibacter sp. BDJ18]
MAIEFYRLNGTNPSFNYKVFEETAKEELCKTCSNAKIYFLNNFPLSVSGLSNIDLLLVISIANRHGNYFRIENDAGKSNIHNLIIALQINTEYAKQEFNIVDSAIESQDLNILEYNEENSALKWGLTNYLSEFCGMEKKSISILPITYVQNLKNYFGEGLIISPKFTFYSLKTFLEKSGKPVYNGYYPWFKDKIHEDLEREITAILEQASKDSNDGYLTKAKIERIQKNLTAPQQNAYDQIGQQLVQVKGKAGTGKSSDLLKWMLRLNTEKTNTAFFTYNHLLVYDITKQVKSFQDIKISQGIKLGTASVQTLHSFFFRLSKKLGVLHLMSEKRSAEILEILDSNLKILESFIRRNIREHQDEISLQKLKYLIQNDKNLKEGTKREGIEFVNEVLQSFTHINTKTDLNALLNTFRSRKKKNLEQLQAQKIFLPDYYNVLKQTLELINNRDSFFDDFNVSKKYELLSPVMNLDKKILDEDSKEPEISREKYRTRINRSLGGIKKGRIIFIDEAQDCHEYERDILFSIFKPENIVIANGGKEQLIRHHILCDWEISRAQKIKSYIYSKRSNSFRMKPAIAHLSNFIANAYDIDLNIEPLNSEDHGKIILDTDFSNETASITRLAHLSAIQGCSPYEGLLVLNNASTTGKNYVGRKVETKIGEYGNITIRESLVREKTPEEEHLNREFRIWDGVVTNKKDLSVPVSSSIRSILYESCRGVEAWCTLCHSLDSFFESKRIEPEAENYLLTDLFDQINNEKRKDMFAATWVLMALTRAIDTCYIHIDNKDSQLSQLIFQFAAKYPHFVETLKKESVF